MNRQSTRTLTQSPTQAHKPRFITLRQVPKSAAIIASLLISAATLSPAQAEFEHKSNANKASVATLNALDAGEPQDVIVVFDDMTIQSELASMRAANPDPSNRQAIREFKRQALGRLKQEVLSTISLAEARTVQDYSHLPMTNMRVDSTQGLSNLLDDPRVTRVYENRENHMSLSEALPLIRQPEAHAAGYLGGGTVAVLDTGVDYTNAAFGACTMPGVTECSVAYAQDFAPEDGVLDDNGHGTNVAAIALSVAPQTRIAALDVFDGPSAMDSWILEAINWAIANQQTYDIVALNLSLGGNSHFASECVDSPYTQAFAAARAAGILPVVAAGNEGNKQGLSSPACAPGALRIGAVYDHAMGPGEWSNCLDYTTDADLITCFSNSAPMLTLLAPGAQITAADITLGGTSQAAPHVAGAVAVLRNSFPHESLEQTVARMTDNGVPVTDPANGLTHPRLDLMAAIEEQNTNPDPSNPDPLELVSPLGSIDTTYPEYQWGALAQASWYYLAILDDGFQTVADGYLDPAQLGCGSGTGACRITPDVALESGKSYYWIVYGGNDQAYETSELGAFSVVAY